MQSTEASTNGDYDPDSTTSDGSWLDTIPSSPSSTRDQVDGSHCLSVIEEGKSEIHTSDSELTIHIASVPTMYGPRSVSIVSLRAGKALPALQRRKGIDRKSPPLTAASAMGTDSCAQSSSIGDQSANRSMIDRPRPIRRKTSSGRIFFCSGNKYTRNGADHVLDFRNSETNDQATLKEDTAPYSRRRDCQESDQPVTLVNSSPTFSGRSSSGDSFVSCKTYVSPKEEATTDPVLCTSTSSSRRQASQSAAFLASQLAAINARGRERMREVTDAHTVSRADASARSASVETDISLQEQFVPSAGSDELYHQYTDSTSRLSGKSSIYSRSVAWGKTMLTKATGRRGRDGDAAERSSDSASNRTQSRTGSRSRKLTNLTGLSSVRRLVRSKWRHRGRHRPTLLTRTHTVHY